MSTASGTQTRAIMRPWWLFAPYAVIPLALGVVLVDGLWGLDLQHTFAVTLEQMLLLSIVLQYPHIIASNLTLLDSEYLKFYSRQIILKAILVALTMAGIYFLLGLFWFFIFFNVWNVYHVVRQQIGIGRILNRQVSRLYEVAGWLFVVSGALISLGLADYFNPIHMLWLSAVLASWSIVDASQPINTVLLSALAHQIIMGMALFTLVFSLFVLPKLRQKAGRYFLLANMAMIASILICYRHFPLFVVLIPRIIHDITAHVFYVVHDTNRNTPAPRQWIYKWTQPYLPIWLVCLGLPLLITGYFVYAKSELLVFISLIVIASHFATEAFIWRGKALHRQFTPMKFNS